LTDEPPSTAVDDRADALAQSRRESTRWRLRAELEETNRGVVALYAELDSQAEQLREATELKSRFLAYMSHEFRTPISAIRSIARLLLDRVDGPLTTSRSAGRLHPAPRDRVRRDGRRPAGPGQGGGGRVDISPAWFEMVDLFSALRGMFKPVLTNPAVLIFEEPEGCPSSTPTTASCRRSCATSSPTRSSSRRRARCA
jgi:hypothetical protein